MARPPILVSTEKSYPRRVDIGMSARLLASAFAVDLWKEFWKVALGQGDEFSSRNGGSTQQNPGYLVRIGHDAEGLVGPRAPEQQLTAGLTTVANRIGASRFETIDA